MSNRRHWALPGIVFASAFAMSAACGSQGPDIGQANCPKENANPTTTSGSGAGTTGAGGATSSGATSGATTTAATSGSGGGMQAKYDTPSAEEIASRLHSCHKLPYNMLSTFLSRRGVAVPTPTSSDMKTTPLMVFGSSTTLAAILGGSGNACRVAAGTGESSNPKPCAMTEQCFCNQDDKVNDTNKNCVTIGNNGDGVVKHDGYCVTKPPTAAFLYLTGKDAFSVPKLDSRLAEKEEHTTASALRLMDIFIQAAPQIAANIGDPIKAPACTLNGKNRPMFDTADGSCVEESVSCLIGTPATDDHMLLCNLIVNKANPNVAGDLQKKRNLAIAALLSAAHSCE